MFAKAYHELYDRHQKEINEFPMAYAFSEEQLKEALKKLHVDISECCTYMGIGDVVRKKDIPALKEMFKRQKDEMHKFLKGNKEDVYEAFKYEMDNHEYAINLDGDADVLGCFSITFDMLKEFGITEEYYRARRDHCKYMEELGVI